MNAQSKSKKKKQSKKNFLAPQQNPSSNKPDLFAFLAYTVILFFGATILVNITPNSNTNYRKDWNPAPIGELEWSFRDVDKKSYSLSKMLLYGSHGSSPDFSFLLPPNDLDVYRERLQQSQILGNTDKADFADLNEEKLHGSAPDIDLSDIPNVSSYVNISD